MTKETLTNAKHKLNEFHRWVRVSGFYPFYFIDSEAGYRLPLFELPDLSSPDWQNRPEWQRQAPEEVNEILRAVNNLKDEGYRAILIASYLAPYADRSSWISFSTTDIMDLLGFKKSKFHRLKRQALLAFAKSYRQGWLETYTEQKKNGPN
ncbi:hypothetical protein [Streptococcus ruminantium]|uniref:hypothetical protein n=1 Tax=Streptococcus ruminantium TaxID=1917441 RepID=UPI0012DF4D6C|nr:hypothetical protein [Streptococcus ruminantium]